MGLFDFLKPKPQRRAVPYDMYDPRGRSYLEKEKEEPWFKWWYVIPIAIMILAILAVMDIGPFKGQYGTNTTTTGPVCGDKTCQSQYENINTCPVDCDPNYKGGPTNFMDFVKSNWVAILIIGIVIWWFFIKKPSDYSDSKAPKIYTLEECRQTAEKILREKGFDNYLPTFHYTNRPDLYAYRYLYKEETYPGINSHKGGGFKEHDRAYFLVEIGYDNELTFFNMTVNEDIAMTWIEEKIGQQKHAIADYRRIRSRSEQPITKREEEMREEQEKYGNIFPDRNYDRDYYDKRRTPPRINQQRGYGGYEP